ncbi:hypothetical protein AYX15_00824 [Cryptococcus neoformans]|nr:hypothetical protein AYX15_00824 [Cryptococcus neoformans var. grubii]
MPKMRFADIAVNLTDPMFEGKYGGRKKHGADIKAVIERAKAKGVEKILITGTSLKESKDALEMAKEFDLHCSAGVHPTSTSEMDKHPSGAEGYLKELTDLIDQDLGEEGSKRIISIGEIGLDYDRLHHSPQETQLAHLPELLCLQKTYRLPLFLHSRTSGSHTDLVRIMKEIGWTTEWGGGVVHSFTGSTEEMKELVNMDLHIGVNGCSLKTLDNLEVIKQIPLDRLLLETDAPWCTPTASHASSAYIPPKDSHLAVQKVSKADKWKEGLGVKGRMEPAEVMISHGFNDAAIHDADLVNKIGIIAHVVASVKGIPIEQLAEQVWQNTVKLFYPHEINGSR